MKAADKLDKFMKMKGEQDSYKKASPPPQRDNNNKPRVNGNNKELGNGTYMISK
jgi:hypothetical protein